MNTMNERGKGFGWIESIFRFPIINNMQLSTLNILVLCTVLICISMYYFAIYTPKNTHKKKSLDETLSTICPLTDEAIRADLLLMKHKFVPMFDQPVPYKPEMTYGEMFYLEDTGEQPHVFDWIVDRVNATTNTNMKTRKNKHTILKEIQDKHLYVVMQLKDRFQKPRPKYNSKRLQILFPIHDVPSAQSPAFPSGHAFCGMMFGAILYRDHKTAINIEEIAEQCFDVGMRRIIGGVHYPSDIVGAFYVVKHITQDWHIERLIQLYESKALRIVS